MDDKDILKEINKFLKHNIWDLNHRSLSPYTTGMLVAYSKIYDLIKVFGILDNVVEKDEKENKVKIVEVKE